MLAHWVPRSQIHMQNTGQGREWDWDWDPPAPEAVLSLRDVVSFSKWLTISSMLYDAPPKTKKVSVVRHLGDS